MPLLRRSPTILRAGSSYSMHGDLPITSQCRASPRACTRLPRKRWAEMIPVRVAQEKNTRNAAGSIKRRRCGPHRMVTFAAGKIRLRIGRFGLGDRSIGLSREARMALRDDHRMRGGEVGRKRFSSVFHETMESQLP